MRPNGTLAAGVVAPAATTGATYLDGDVSVAPSAKVLPEHIP